MLRREIPKLDRRPVAERSLRKAPSTPAPPAQRFPISQPAQAIAVSVAASLLLSCQPAWALGLESFDISGLLPNSESSATSQTRSLNEADDARFNESPTLKSLLEKSQKNRAQNKKDITDKYCFRQAELGIGDCGGLQLIPGVTQNGKQKTPDWLANLLGVEIPEETEATKGKTIQQLIRPEGGNTDIFN